MKLDTETIEEKEEEYYVKRSKGEFEEFKNCPLFIREEEKLKRLPNSLSKPFGEEGGWGMNDLVWIAYWKLRSQLLKNREDDVKKIFEYVRNLDENQVEDKISKLTELHGVGIAVASAILTFMDPENYTIIDQHAVRALKEELNKLDDFPTNSDKWDSEHYKDYLKACVELADEQIDEKDHEYPLRTVDRVLWSIGEHRKNGEKDE